MSSTAQRRANIRSVHGVDYCGSRHPILKQLHEEIPPTFFGSQLWRSSFMVMEYLLEHPPTPDTRVIEVGCGWGLLGIFCAKTFDCDVLLTDKEERVFPYAHAHLELNGVEAETAVLDFRDFKSSHFENRDLMLGSDICFWPEHVGIIKKLVSQAMSAGVKTIILADPGRYPFMQVVRYCEENYHCELMHRTLGDRKTKGYLLVIKQ